MPAIAAMINFYRVLGRAPTGALSGGFGNAIGVRRPGELAGRVDQDLANYELVVTEFF